MITSLLFIFLSGALYAQDTVPDEIQYTEPYEMGEINLDSLKPKPKIKPSPKQGEVRHKARSISSAQTRQTSECPAYLLRPEYRGGAKGNAVDKLFAPFPWEKGRAG
ncbi:MAG: hypothetical protein WCG27_07320 [Pseudomonadota bacterium]